jgi:hypothetical protein
MGKGLALRTTVELSAMNLTRMGQAAIRIKKFVLE